VDIISESDTSTIIVKQNIPEPILLKIDSAICLDIVIEVEEFGGAILSQCYEDNSIYVKTLVCFPHSWSQRKVKRIINKQFREPSKYSDFEKFLSAERVIGIY